MPTIKLPNNPRWLAAAAKPLRGHPVRVTLTDESTLSGRLESVDLKSQEITLIPLASTDVQHTVHASQIESIEVMVRIRYCYGGFVGEPGPRSITGVVVHSDEKTLVIDCGHKSFVVDRNAIISSDSPFL